MAFSKTINSNVNPTKDIFAESFFPNVDILEGQRFGILVNDFTGHQTDSM